MVKFKIGDQVRDCRYGDGEVIGFHNISNMPCVQFDFKHEFMHDGNGDGANGYDKHCFYCCPTNLKKRSK